MHVGRERFADVALAGCGIFEAMIIGYVSRAESGISELGGRDPQQIEVQVA